MWMNLKSNVESKRSSAKKYILHDSICGKFKSRQNLWMISPLRKARKVNVMKIRIIVPLGRNIGVVAGKGPWVGSFGNVYNISFLFVFFSLKIIPTVI